MYRKKARWISWFLIFAMLASLFAISAMAAEDGGTEAAATDETPVVNVLDAESAQEDEPPADIAAPEQTAEPQPQPEPEEPEQTAAPQPETKEDDAAEEPLASEEAPPADDGSGDPPKYTVTYMSGETVIATEDVAEGGKPANIPAKDAAGVDILGWTDGDGAFVDTAALTVTGAVTLHAWYKPGLNTKDHIRYINGMGNASFGPTASLTRAAAAVILYALLDDQSMGPVVKQFSDVPEDAWYAKAVNTLASCSILSGYPDGAFLPNYEVTRGEFVTMLVNITGATGSSVTFNDVKSTKDHWAANAILAAASSGWISGFPEDGTFRPYDTMTRAQAVTAVNRVLGRTADKAALAKGDHILHYLDVDEGDWWYGAVMEASIGHKYSKDADGETWKEYNRESSGMSAGLHNLGSCYCYVDSQYRQPVAVEQGVNEIEGKYYYAAAKGYTITADLSGTEGYAVLPGGGALALSDGLNMLDSTLFHWNVKRREATKLTQGVNKLPFTDSKGKEYYGGYWADAPGYSIRILSKGVVELNGDLYLSADGYAILTTGYSTADGQERKAPVRGDLQERLYEYNNNMYYIKEGYKLATNEWYGYLYFGEDGRYTSGDAQLDSYVWNIVKNIAGNNVTTKEQKLLAAYYKIRGGEGKTYRTSDYSYRSVKSWMNNGRYKSQAIMPKFIAFAKTFFSKHYGMCYEWASGYLYVARRLGFQCYPVVGGVWSTENKHCWALIKWAGKWHISDLELEWGHVSGYYQGYQSFIYRDMFAMELSSENVKKYTYYNENGAVLIPYTFP